MDTCYCVFWFPTIFHREKISIFEKRDEENCNVERSISSVSIADDDEKDNLFLEITEKLQASNEDDPKEEKKYDLFFILTDQEGHEIRSCFRCVDQTRNGFVIYSYNRTELINDYWNRFEEEEQKEIIEKVRGRVIKQIKMKYHPKIAPNPNDELIKNYIIDRILISFYHHAKQFYHEHETHSESDAKYNAYYYSEEREDGSRDYLKETPSLSKKNNPVINWYIDQFERRIIENAETISKYYKEWSIVFKDTFNLKSRYAKAQAGNNSDEILDLVGEIQIRNHTVSQLGKSGLPEMPKFNEISKSIDEQKDFLTKIYQDSFTIYVNELYEGLTALSKECTDSLIEYTYCQTLLGSKYNDDYKHGSAFSESELELFSHLHPSLIRRDFRRKKAFNIRNSIRYIEAIRQKCDFWGIRITEMLMEEVHGISNDNETILDKIKKLTAANSGVLRDIQELTNSNNAVLCTVQTLINSNKDVLGNINELTTANNKALNEAEKSNERSSLLGWLSFAISLISLGVSFGDKKECKLIIVGVAAAILIIVGIIKLGGKKYSKKKGTDL